MISFIKRVLYKIIRKIEQNESKPELDESIKLGDGSIFLESSKIDFRTAKEKRIYVNVGARCLISSNFIFETALGNIEIGNNVHIGGAVLICRSFIKIEDDVTMAWGITLYDHNSHSIYWEHRKNDNINCYNDYLNCDGNNIVNKDWSNVIAKPIIIESKVWIGYDVTILKGVTIGEGAVIGAKSVVTRDVPAWSVAAGNPARVVKMLR